MADSRQQLRCERWVREEWLPYKFGVEFKEQEVSLSSGGTFKFDAVSDDGAIVAVISTSSSLTGTRKLGTGKMHKIRADILFLVLADPRDSLVIFTEADMLTFWERERGKGRVPRHIRFLHAPLPEDLATDLLAAKRRASQEVSPSAT